MQSAASAVSAESATETVGNRPEALRNIGGIVMERIGLLAGAGKLPVECARAAKLLGYEVYAVALLPETDAELKECTADCQFISIAHLDDVLNYLKEHQVSKVTMIGKVTKELLFSGKVQPDARMMKLIMEQVNHI